MKTFHHETYLTRNAEGWSLSRDERPLIREMKTCENTRYTGEAGCRVRLRTF